MIPAARARLARPTRATPCRPWSPACGTRPAPVARLEELRLAATEDRIETDLQLGRGAELAPEAEELATAHPLRERLRGQLMRILYLAGRQGDALKVYEDTRRLLADRLGVDPSPALSAVHLAILRADPGLGQPAGNGTAPAPGPSVYLPPRISNLPAQLTSFVGRDEELNRLSKLLAESRLVILTGPGGTGKTRLAIEASARIADQMPDGVWFVPLARWGTRWSYPRPCCPRSAHRKRSGSRTGIRSGWSCRRWTGWPTCWPPASWSWCWTTVST